jgi:hypothetical protein
MNWLLNPLPNQLDESFLPCIIRCSLCSRLCFIDCQGQKSGPVCD